MTYEEPRVYCVNRFPSVLNGPTREVPNPMQSPDWRVEGLLRFIDSQGGKLGWDLTQLCDRLELGISGPHAAKLFSRHTGIGIREYAKERRLGLAAQQLRCTTDSIKQIALELGYRNPNDLRRQFKKRFCLNPTEFRVAYRLAINSLASGAPAHCANVKELRRCNA